MNRVARFFYRMRTFPSIPLFFILKSNVEVELAILAAAGYAIIYTMVAAASKKSIQFDYGITIFWILIFTAKAVFPIYVYPLFSNYFTTLFYLSLFLTALLPVVFNQEPFTTAFARKRSPKEVWQTEQFIAINRVMSLTWAGLFLAAATVALLPTIWCKVFLPVALMVIIGVPFTQRFPDYYLKRRSQTSASSSGAKKAIHQFHNNEDLEVRPDSYNHSTDTERQRANEELGQIKNAVVVFGSPRGKKGHTFKLLDRFLAGLADGGVKHEFISLAENKIHPCVGCFNCWTKTPGTCIHKDDMAELIQKVSKADLVVYAQPLYTFSVPGITKNFLDRMLPHLEPYLYERQDGATRHPLRWRKDNGGRMCVFSVCGFPEIKHFEPMLAMFRALSQNSGSTIIGEIVRPASESLHFSERFGEKYEKLLSDLYEAGIQVAKHGYVKKETEVNIATPFFPNLKSFRQIANRSWDTMIEYEEKKNNKETLPDRTEYLKNHPRMFFGGMASMYNPDQGHGFKGVVQFELTDREGGSYYLEVNDQECRLGEGAAKDADLTIQTPYDVWVAISRGEISGQEAFMKGLYKTVGDLTLLNKMQHAFSN